LPFIASSNKDSAEKLNNAKGKLRAKSVAIDAQAL
jgi:hypothetical protein